MFSSEILITYLNIFNFNLISSVVSAYLTILSTN